METKIFNVASYKRKDSLLKTINSIYNQADVINIALNDYDEIPVELYDKKINLYVTDNSKGDAFKFIVLENSNGYFFTIDDDLCYPPDYAEFMIKKVNQYGKKNIVTLHGRSFKKFPISSYYNSESNRYHCLHEVKNDVEIQFGGTGVMCFHTDTLKLNIDYFQHPNMADVWIGKAAKENGLKIICVEHRKNYLSYISQSDTIFDSQVKNDKIQTDIVNTTYGYPTTKSGENNIVILATLWNAAKQIPKFVESIKNQSYKNFRVVVIHDNSSDTSFSLLNRLTNGDNRFSIVRNKEQKFKTQNFYEVIHNSKLINDDDIIIELDGDDCFSDSQVVQKVVNNFQNGNLWIAGYRWVDNRGKKSPFKHGPNADNPRSNAWAFSAMRVFKAFLFKKIKKEDLMFEGVFIKAANDIAYGMPMLEMAGNEHFKSFSDITYIYNWHDKNTHTSGSSVKDTSLQKRTEKYLYSLPRYKKITIANDNLKKQTPNLKNNIDTPKNTNKTNQKTISDVINKKYVLKNDKILDEKIVVKEVPKPEIVYEKKPIVKKDLSKLSSIIKTNQVNKQQNTINLKKLEPTNITNNEKNKIVDKTKLEQFEERNKKTDIIKSVISQPKIVKPQNKNDIDNRRKEWQQIFLTKR